MNARLRNPPLYNIQHHAPHNEWLVMDEQEKRKLDRKRARNRAAATKCRQKKIDRIQELETMVTQEKQRAQGLDMEMESMRNTLQQLQQLIQMHEQRGCARS
ncbi:hypothetical protein Q1695_013302 [Nippostrongylus brasiliensis]|nr:hypothetical protein Q1695_013302 [Nippostrongylus brasiliensis]